MIHAWREMRVGTPAAGAHRGRALTPSRAQGAPASVLATGPTGTGSPPGAATRIRTPPSSGASTRSYVTGWRAGLCRFTCYDATVLVTGESGLTYSHRNASMPFISSLDKL
jgi:hypothetical protein